MIAVDKIKSILSYNPDTGKFIWIVDRNNKTTAGTQAGHLTKKGYIVIKLYNKAYKASRVAFAYMTGNWPDKTQVVDHINRDRSDNRWTNLRLANYSQNSVNRKAYRPYKYKGVYWNKRDGFYQAVIKSNGKSKSLGYFDNPEEAYLAYKKAAIEMWGLEWIVI